MTYKNKIITQKFKKLLQLNNEDEWDYLDEMLDKIQNNPKKKISTEAISYNPFL